MALKRLSLQHECIGHCEFNKFAEASYKYMHTITEEQRARLGELNKEKRQKEIFEKVNTSMENGIK